jgi:hypothetical protein
LFRKFIYLFRKGEVQTKEVERERCRGEKWNKGEKMIDLVIEGRDLIRDMRGPKHW